MKRSTPLQRKTPITRTGRLLRKTYIRRISGRRAVQRVVYLEKRCEFLRKHPICQVCHHAKSCDVHHRKGRLGSHYLDESTWLATCRNCHRAIHERPSEARKKGLLA